jgi:Raf kinase inhibitor-like YbhB/YbcL family protein
MPIGISVGPPVLTINQGTTFMVTDLDGAQLMAGRTMHRGLAFGIAVLLIVSAACSSTSSTTSDKTVGVALPMTLTSTAFVDGGAIPMDFSCDGRNISPPLSWSAPPSATQALVIVLDDQDATFTHWALYDLLSGMSLPSGVPATATLASGGEQGLNSAGKVDYTGPCPPHGSTHHYVFRIIALDSPTRLPPGAKPSDVQNAMQGHIIATGELAATFGR